MLETRGDEQSLIYFSWTLYAFRYQPLEVVEDVSPFMEENRKEENEQKKR